MTTLLLILLTASILFLIFKKKDKPLEPYTIDYDDEDLKPFPHRSKLTKEEVLNRMETVKLYDDFKECFTLSFYHVGNEDSFYLPMYYDEELGIVGMDHIGIAFILEDKDAFLEVYSLAKEIPLGKGDRLTFLFENDERLEIIFSEKGSSGSVKSNNIYLLNIEQIKVFSLNRLLKWKYTGVNKIEIVGDNSMFCPVSDIPNKDTSQEIIMKMASNINKLYSLKYHSFEDVSDK